MNDNSQTIPPKLAFGFLGGLAVLTLVLGTFKITNDIKSPFYSDDSVQDNLTDVNSAESDIARLQAQDTDLDGLSDYDELNIYQTSPYLPDSDSDGFSDKEEIDSGNDPNCPAGQECRTDKVAPLNTNPPPLDVPGFSPGQLDSGKGAGQSIIGSGEALSPEIVQQFQDLSAEEIRQLLKSSGQLTEEQIKQLEQIDDQTLLEIYKEVLKGEQ